MTAKENDNLDSTDLEVIFSHFFLEWLRRRNSSLLLACPGISTLFFISPDFSPKKNFNLIPRYHPSCKGITLAGDDFYVFSDQQIQLYKESRAERSDSISQDKIYVPQKAFSTGNREIQDFVIGMSKQFFYVSITDNAVMRTNLKDKPEMVWHLNSFAEELPVLQDCYLTGMALVDGMPKYVTATKDVGGEGFVINIQSRQIISSDLSMPQCPRFYRDKLWLLNAGTGYFGYLENHVFMPVTFCPAYIRGLYFVDNYAFVTLSKPTDAQLARSVTLRENIMHSQVMARTGIYMINLHNGQIVHWIQFRGLINEISNVVYLKGVENTIAIC